MPGALSISAGAIDELLKICLIPSRREQVGLLLGLGRTVVSVTALNNLHKQSVVKGFRVALSEITDRENHAAGAGLEVIGRFHTHPNSPAFPSASDIASLPSGWVEVIVQVKVLTRSAELGQFYAYEGANIPLGLEFKRKAV